MSLQKNLKTLFLMTIIALFFAGCAGSGGGGDAQIDPVTGEQVGGAGAQEEEKVDADELKKTEEEAMAVEKENHELRSDIFKAKNKLGIQE